MTGRKNLYRAARLAHELGLHRATIEHGAPYPFRGSEGRKLPKDREALRQLADECWTCGGQGHKHTQCPTVECHACGEFGHMKRHCPQRAK